jgi:uncharacterized membrane protein
VSSRRVTSGPHTVVAETWSATTIGLLLLFEWRVTPGAYLGLIWMVTGLSSVAAGLLASRAALRGLGYLVVTMGTIRVVIDVFGPGDPTLTAIAHLCFVSAALYGLGLVVRRWDARRAARGGGDDAAASVAVVGATACVAGLVLQEVQASLVTFLLGLHGLALMGAGLAVRDRLWRILGLGLLLGAILKVFFYDLRELDALPRIFSFVVLGLILLGISWAYTRYRDAIRKLL